MDLTVRSVAEQESSKAALRPVAVDMLRAFRMGGFPNPMAALEQLSFLLLLRYLEERDQLELETGERHESWFSDSRWRWSTLVDAAPDIRRKLLHSFTFADFLRDPPVGGGAFASAMHDAVFVTTAPELLDRIVKRLASLKPRPFLCADLLDAWLDEVSATSQVPSPRTPSAVTRCMLALTQPAREDRVLDPAAGAGDRLLALHRLAGRAHRAETLGVDLDVTMVRLGLMSLLFHGVKEPNLWSANVLANRPAGQFDVVLCQPPFGARFDPSMLSPERRDPPNTRSEVLFSELTLDVLSPGGRAAIVLPASATFGAAMPLRRLRRRLVDSGVLRAVVALPAGTFQPHTNVETVVLAIGPAASSVVAFVDTRPHSDEGQTSEHDAVTALEHAGEIVERLLGRGLQDDDVTRLIERGRAFVVDAKTITENGYSLLASTYRSPEHAPAPTERPLELMNELEDLEQEISNHLSGLRTRLSARDRIDG